MGGSARRIPAYAGGVALGYQPLARLREEIGAVLAAGYRALKPRLGETPTRDIERVRGVRRHLGDDVDQIQVRDYGEPIFAVMPGSTRHPVEKARRRRP